MKIKKIFIVLILFMVIAGIAGFWITFNVSRQTTIKVSTLNLSTLLSKLENWKNWDTAVFNKRDSITIIPVSKDKKVQAAIQDKATLKLTIINPALFELERQQNYRITTIQIISLQFSKKEGYTDVQWVTQQNAFQWLIEKLMGDNEISEQLSKLKKFAESTQGLYGFPIRLIKVTDPFICTKREIIPQADVQAHIQKLLTEMRLFLKANSVAATKNYYYVASVPINKGQTDLGVGIPVKALLHPKGGFELLKLPADGNLLVGSYQGNPSDIQKLYDAMDQYVADKRLSRVARPMEIHYGIPDTLNDKSSVSIQVVYPVY